MNKTELLATAKPMPFNAEMVRAMFDDLKSVTRRKIKHDTKAVLSSPARLSLPDVSDNVFIEKLCLAPCEVGDILYVCETFCEHPKQLAKYYFRATSICDGKSDAWGCPEAYDHTENCDLCECFSGYIKWHSPIHMPKEAARIFLRVTAVKTERLQDITEEQAKAEGVKSYWAPPHDDMAFLGCELNTYDTRVKAFSHIWNSTVKKADLDTYGWNANPWVWVIYFERIETE